MQYLLSDDRNIEIVVTEQIDKDFGLHTHTGHYIVSHITRGGANLHYNNVNVALSEGDTFIIRPYMPHSVAVNSGAQIISLCIKTELLKTETAETLCKTIGQMYDESGICPDAKTFFDDAVRQIYSTIDDERYRLPSEIQAIADKIMQMSDGICDLDKLSEEVYVSKYHLIRKFKSKIGITPHQFLIQVRVRNAQKDIAAGGRLIDAAIDNGFYEGKAGFFYSLPAFVIVLGMLLFAMSVYRSPAVALMPDVTPKPLRARANAIINLMGAAGGIIYLAFTALTFPKSKTEGMEHVDYRLLFIFMAIFMMACVIIMAVTVNEPKLSAENERIEKEHPEWDLTVEDKVSGGAKLPAPVLKSMVFLLLSIALWYIGYNAVTTWFTTYISVLMGEGLGGASTCFLIANVGAIVSYIPIGSMAAKVGRKKMIYFGTLLIR